ncbi:hypothetical protein H0H81_004776 [Sphagnurus paluster]|uniref:Uncharacterized protein n=1 Tax=Sphagnurus paluster TaxID=117069 RepID=A0A9P7GNH0_9AGAR|nr:hypothetical protein H0H81_004776 [Sphagnurus paluster]
MAGTDVICQIPGNSDIAGIGVRASVYVQACLAGFNLLYLVHTRVYNDVRREDEIEMVSPSLGNSARASTSACNISSANQASTRLISRPPSQKSHATNISATPADLEAAREASSFKAFIHSNSEFIGLAKGLERSLFMIGFAVILSAIIQARSASGLTAYHALIVLNISQINNWAGFVLLVFRGGFRPLEGGGWAGNLLVTKDSLVSSIPCSVHAVVMSGLGMYFWANLTPFLGYASAAPVQPCRAVTYYWVFGRGIEISEKGLRNGSIVFYAVSAIPILGLYLLGAFMVLAILGFLVAFTILVLVLGVAFMIVSMIAYPIFTLIIRPFFRLHFIQLLMTLLSRPFSSVAQRIHTIQRSVQSYTTALLVGPIYSQLFTFPIGLSICAPLIYTIVSTELTIRINSPNVEPGAENAWTYGQTLALFSAIVAIALYVLELVKMARKWKRKILAGEIARSLTSSVQQSLGAGPVYVEKDTQTEGLGDAHNPVV